MSDSYPEAQKKQNLWRCDCANEGHNTSIDYHEAGCNYALWYVLNFDNGGDNEESEDEE